MIHGDSPPPIADKQYILWGPVPNVFPSVCPENLLLILLDLWISLVYNVLSVKSSLPYGRAPFRGPFFKRIIQHMFFNKNSLKKMIILMTVMLALTGCSTAGLLQENNYIILNKDLTGSFCVEGSVMDFTWDDLSFNIGGEIVPYQVTDTGISARFSNRLLGGALNDDAIISYIREDK